MDKWITLALCNTDCHWEFTVEFCDKYIVFKDKISLLNKKNGLIGDLIMLTFSRIN